MSEYLDERIVSIKFDNSGFEDKVSDTQKSLDDLNKSLSFEGAEKGADSLSKAFKEVSTEAKKTDLTPLADSVENIKNKFNALETVAVGALLRIGAQAVELGEKLIKSVAVDPIKQGFDKYQDILTSQMTLTAALGGETEAEVEHNAKLIKDTLEQLTWYADETSYSLDDMIRNVSQFANYGVSLDDAKTAMMGIANASAKSGAPLAAASHAMEGFSKAMGQGYMSYQVWRTWLNSSKITTLDFKNTFIETAKEMIRGGATLSSKIKLVGDDLEYYAGKNEGWLKVTAENIENSLTKGQWLTSDVMLAGLAKYSASMDDLYEATDHGSRAVSELFENSEYGFDKFSTEAFKYAQQCKTLKDVIDSLFDATSTTWYRMFQSLIGDYKQTVDLWSNFAEYLFEWFVYPLQEVAHMVDTFAKTTSNVKDEVTGNFMTMREVVVDSFMNILEAIKSVIEPIKEAFNAVFRPFETLPKHLQNGVENFHSFTESLILTTEEAEKLRDKFAFIFTLFKKIWTFLKELVNNLKKNVKPLIEKISSFAINTVSIIIKSILKLLSVISKFASELLGVPDIFESVKNAIIDAAKSVDKLDYTLEDNADQLENTSDSYKTHSDYIKKYTDDIKKATGAVKDLTKEEKKKSYAIAGGYVGESYLSYAQAQEEVNHKLLAEFIKENNITEQQYESFVKLLDARKKGYEVYYDDMVKILDGDTKLANRLYTLIDDSLVAYQNTAKEIENIKLRGSESEAKQYETILDGIYEAQKNTLIKQGDLNALLDLYFNKNIRNTTEIAEAIGVEEWKVRELTKAYKEAYDVENYLNKKKKQATSENINQSREELGYIKKKKEETEKLSGIAAAEARRAERDRIREEKAAERLALRNRSVETKRFEPSMDVASQINQAVGQMEEYQNNIDTLPVTTKNAFSEILDSTDEVSEAIESIGTTSERSANVVKDSSSYMAESFKTLEQNINESATNIEKDAGRIDSALAGGTKGENSKSDKSNFSDSIIEFFGDESLASDLEKSPVVTTLTNVITILRNGFKEFNDDFNEFFVHPIESIKSGFQTIKDTVDALINLLFKKEDKKQGVLGTMTELDDKTLWDVVLENLQKLRDFLNDPIKWYEFWNLALLNHEMKVLSKILHKFLDNLNIDGMGDEILKISVGIMVLVSALFALSKIDSKALDDAMDVFERLAKVIGIMVGGITLLLGVYNLLSLAGSGIPGAISHILTTLFGKHKFIEEVADLMMSMAKSLAILVAAIAALSYVFEKLDKKAVTSAIIFVSVFFGLLVAFVIAMAAITKKDEATNPKMVSVKLIDFSRNYTNYISEMVDALSEALIKISIAFALLSFIVDKYFSKNGKMDWGKFAMVSIIFTSFLGIIVGLVFLMNKIMGEIGKDDKIDKSKIKAISNIIDPIIKAFVILTGVYFAISKIIESASSAGTFGATNTVMIVMAAYILGAIYVVTELAKRIATSKGFDSVVKAMSKMILLISGVFVVIAGAFFIISRAIQDLSTGQMIGAITAMGFALAAFCALVIIFFKELSKPEVMKAIKKSDLMKNGLTGSILKMAVAISLILVAISAIFSSINGIDLNGTDYIGLAAMMAIPLAAFGILIALLLKNNALTKKAKLNNDIIKVIGVVGAIVVGIVGATAAIFGTLKGSNLEMKDYLGVAAILGSAFIGFGILLFIISKMVEMSRRFSFTQLQALTGMANIIKVLAGAVYVIVLAVVSVIRALKQSSQDMNAEGATSAIEGTVLPGLEGAVGGGGGAAPTEVIGKMANSSNPIMIAIATILGVMLLLGILIGEIALIAKTLNPAQAAIIKALGPVILEIAGSVVLIGLAIGKLAQDLSSVDESTMKTAIITIAVIFGVLIALFAIITAVVAATGGVGGVAMGSAVAIIAGLALSLLLVSAAVYVLAVGIERLVKALISIGDANKKLIKSLETIRDAFPIIKDIIIQAISAIVLGVAEGIIQSVVGIARAIVTGFVTILQVIAENAPQIASAFETIIPLLINVLTMILSALFVVLNNALPQFREWLLNLLGVIEEGLDSILTWLRTSAIPNLEKMLLQIVRWLGFTFGPALLGSIANMWNLINGFLVNTILPDLRTFAHELVETALGIVDDLLSSLHTHTVGWANELVDWIVDFIDAIANGVDKIGDAIDNLLIAIADQILETCKTGGAVFAKIILIPAAIWEGFVGELRKQFGLDDNDNATEGTGIFEIGKQIVMGLIEGITNFVGGIGELAKKLAKAFLDALKGKDGVETASPSKKTYKIGKYIGEGLVNGINDSAEAVTDSAYNLSNSFMNPMKKNLKSFSAVTSSMLSDLIDADMDINPVITPVFDMTNLDYAASSMDRLFDSKNAVEVATSFHAMKLGQEMEKFNQNVGNSDTTPQAPTYNYTQNNYSPKALSPIEIYRRTHNQLKVAKNLEYGNAEGWVLAK